MPAEPTPPLFSASQRRIVSFALTLLAILGSGVLLVAALVAVGRFLGYFSSVLWPLAVALVFALLLRPLVEVLEVRLKLRRLSAVFLLYGVFVLAMTATIVVVLPPLVDQLLDFIAYLPALWTNIGNYVTEHYPRWIELTKRQLANPTVRQLADALAREGKTLFAHAIPSLWSLFGGLFDVAGFVAHLAIIPVYLFFFLLTRGEITRNLGENLPFLRPAIRADVTFLVNEFVAIIESFFRGQLLIGLSMGVMLSIGFSVIGLKFGLFIGLVLGLLNIVPYLGTIIGLGVALPLAFFQPGGGWHLVGLLLVVKVIVQCAEGWWLTPRIMGQRTGLHPVTIIVAIFFWGTAFGGVLGMLLAVPLTAFFVTAWRLAKQKYFRPDDAATASP